MVSSTRNPIKKFIIYIVLLGIIFLFFQILTGPSSLTTTNNIVNPYIETINTQLQIINSLKTVDNHELSTLAQKKMEAYSNELKRLCRRQFLFLKQDCQLTDLSKQNLIILQEHLEMSIQELVDAQ